MLCRRIASRLEGATSTRFSAPMTSLRSLAARSAPRRAIGHAGARTAAAAAPARRRATGRCSRGLPCRRRSRAGRCWRRSSRPPGSSPSGCSRWRSDSVCAGALAVLRIEDRIGRAARAGTGWPARDAPGSTGAVGSADDVAGSSVARSVGADSRSSHRSSRSSRRSSRGADAEADGRRRPR